jgi:hypothetical protein
MRVLLLFFSIILWAFQAEGQIKSENIGLEISKKNHLEFAKGLKYIDEKQIAGSPYLNKQFQPSYISKINGTEIRDMELRYNIYNDQMEFKKDGTILSIALPNEVARINMSGKVFIYKPYMTAKNVSTGYFQVLYEGDYQLLKKEQVKLRSSSEKTNPDDSLRFERVSPQFYLRYGDGMAHFIYSQKTLIKVLQPISQNVINYIKSNKINTKDEKQLIELMEYMDQNTK